MSSLKEAKDSAVTQLLGNGRDLYLHGRNAEGVFQYIIANFPMPILDMRYHNFSNSPSSNYFVVAVRPDDMSLLEDRGMMSSVSEKARLIVIDENGSRDSKPEMEGRDFYIMEARIFLQREGRYDVDIGIKYAMASLYLDVFDAFVTHGEGMRQPYFQTSKIIEYHRSKPMLEGLLLSTFKRKKFDNIEVIASRELIGEFYQHKVRMYELAEMIAQRLGKEAVKIEETTGKETEEKYVIESDIEGRNVLVLDDVLMSGKTILSLKEAVNEAQGLYNGAVVLMDRSEEHLQDVYALTDMKTFMELKEKRDQQNGHKL